eukprot:TRINITY_DN4073_c0_g2_i9.p3 TRINITY_DN4073_c0_g2~~TRINITY_DN4073_c0_g2_i9.p3  ORF type:complete len:158 (+),score=15.86 TRINITY_DN4073_c0_g2_i9:154-627(+)
MLKSFRQYVEGIFLGTNKRAAPIKSVINEQGQKSEITVLDFQNGLPENPKFRSINDNVMGGVSEGQISWDEQQGAARFFGVLSKRNNGGFSSVRSFVWDGLAVAESEGLKMLVKGDGRLYKFNARVGMLSKRSMKKSQQNCNQSTHRSPNMLHFSIP